jgi:hypothetical protein
MYWSEDETITRSSEKSFQRFSNTLLSVIFCDLAEYSNKSNFSIMLSPEPGRKGYF